MTSVNELVISALKQFDIPIALNNYDNKDNLDKYIVWNVSDDRGTYYADDIPLYDDVNIQVHLFINDNINYLQLKKQIRNALVNKGFDYPSVTILHESEEKLNHIVFECAICLKSELEREE